MASLQPPLRVLHFYAQPDDAGFLAQQQVYAREHPWFRVRKLAARSHFPMFEVPREMARAIGEFARSSSSARI
jgi:pimeloyl-ACP methyl ester carboxylesterase